MRQCGHLDAVGVSGFLWLRQLLGIAKQYQAVRRRSNGQRIGE
jgi:hypothetical protein